MKTNFLKLTSIILIFFSVIQVNAQCGLLDLPFNGNAKDVSGNNRHGTVFGAKLATDRFGKANSAYEFDGVNDYIKVDTSGLKNNTYSVSLWAKLKSIPNLRTGYIALSIGQTGGDQQIIYVNHSTKKLNGWGCSSYSQGYPADTNRGLSTDTSTWHHLVTTRNNNEIKLYFDGVLYGTMPIGNRNADYGSRAQVSIGARWGAIQFFHGFIDDIKLYDCVLSSSEILKLAGVKTGVVEKKELVNRVVVHPNPNNGRVTINMEREGEFVFVQIHTFSGQLLDEKVIGPSKEFELDLPNSSGVYFLTVYDNGILVQRMKLIKN